MSPDAPISFYVPARNAERHLADCINAVRKQTRPCDELFIVVDPRSSDRTVQIAGQLGVPVVEQQGTSLGAARNTAIRAARHRWLASCDSDVFLQPDWLERIATRRDEGAAGIGGRTFENVRSPFDDWRSIQMPHHWGEYALRNPFMLVSEVLFDREALLAIGGYRDDLSYYEDSDLCQRLRDAGYDLLYEPTAVAYHQRSDALISVLDLRWKYAEYRQRHLLDRYADLLRKLDINREYTLNTLSKLLARGREDLGYISFLLYFHHALMDLRSLQSRCPLLPAEQRSGAETQLLKTITTQLSTVSPGLADSVGRDLARVNQAGIADAAETPSLPAWPGYIAGVCRAVEAFCEEVTPPVLRIVETSAQYLHGNTAADAIARLTRPSTTTLQESLDALPPRIAPTAELIDTVRSTWPGTAGVELVGRVSNSELEALRHAVREGTSVGLVLHLETQPDPLLAFSQFHARFDRLVVCYQPPPRFIPGLDVVSASDLASAAVAAGWTIDRFDTLIGRTRLMLSKTENPR